MRKTVKPEKSVFKQKLFSGLVQEPYDLSHKSQQMLCKMRGILPFLSGSCSKTEVFEQPNNRRYKQLY
jgi:hypothetical protein